MASTVFSVFSVQSVSQEISFRARPSMTTILQCPPSFVDIQGILKKVTRSQPLYCVTARLALFTPHTYFSPPSRRKAVACNSNIRIYRYAVGQRFGKHIDESVEDENGHLSQWTVLVYLNGGSSLGKTDSSEGGASAGGGVVEEEAPLRGGETVFYKVKTGGGS